MSATIDQLLRELERTRFYGAVELKYEAGHVVLIRKTETFKPTQNYGNNRGVYVESKSER